MLGYGVDILWRTQVVYISTLQWLTCVIEFKNDNFLRHELFSSGWMQDLLIHKPVTNKQKVAQSSQHGTRK